MDGSPEFRPDGTSKFVWPPRPQTEPELTRAPSVFHPSPRRERLGTATKVALSIERVWMGLSRAPWSMRCSEAGWTPDAWDRYCPRCATTIGPHEADRLEGGEFVGCHACQGKYLAWNRAVRLGEFEGLLREAIHEVKFTRWGALGRTLGLELGQQVASVLRSERIDPKRILVVPVATSLPRRVYRGIDHSMVIARGVAEAIGCSVVPALSRRHRPSQVDMPPSKRDSNAAGSFRLRPGVQTDDRSIILVDDVRTTGATLTAACRELLRNRRNSVTGGDGRSVWVAVLGVTPEKADRQPTRVLASPKNGRALDDAARESDGANS